MTLITSTWDGRILPVAFHIAAWGTTVHHFSGQLRIAKRTMKEVVDHVGAWEHYWKSFPSASSGQQNVPGGRDNNDLASQLVAMRSQPNVYKQQAEQSEKSDNGFPFEP